MIVILSLTCFSFLDVSTGYVKAAAALCVITLLTDVVATVLTGLGIRTKDHRTKYKYYRFAVLVMLVACKYTYLLNTSKGKEEGGLGGG